MARKPDTPCVGCGTLMWSGSTSLPVGVAMCRACRRSGNGARRVASSTKTCAVCASILGGSKLPQGRAMCTRCRRVMVDLSPCVDCDAPARGLRCKPCHVAAARAQAKGRDLDARNALMARRDERLRAAGGLSRHGMGKLRAKWIKQRRRCTYCESLATTVDHVIPVALGGTSHEGNLTPACKPCNTRKNDSLLVEWKQKIRSARGAGSARAA